MIFMGVHHVTEIIERILAAGRDPQTPAMAVRWGTRPDQHTIAGTLAELPELIRDLAPPATIIIGEVVSLRSKLDWFEHLPLFGERVVVTRAKSQAAELSQYLRSTRRRGDRTSRHRTRAIGRLFEAGCLPWTNSRPTTGWFSPARTAVGFFLQRLRACNRDWRAVRGRICAIGPATAEALDPDHPGYSFPKAS